MFDFIKKRFKCKPKASPVERVRPSRGGSPSSSSVEPSRTTLDPLNSFSPLNPINQTDSYEPQRSHSHCSSSSYGGYDSGSYSSSDSCSSSSSSDSSSSSSSSD